MNILKCCAVSFIDIDCDKVKTEDQTCIDSSYHVFKTK